MTVPNPNHLGAADPRSPEVLLPPAIWCSAGSEVGFDVTVTHRGAEAALLTLTVLGLDGRWAPEPAVIGPLEPGQSAQVTLTLVPERGALGARYPFVVAAEASSRKGERPVMGVGESTLTVDARERLVVAVVPPQVTAVFGKRVDLQISNPGSVDRSLSLTSDDVGGAILRLSENSVLVPAGQTSTVRGKIKVRHPRMFGSGGVHAVGVTARDSGAPEHAGATVRARPLIRNGLRTGVILGLVLLLWVTAAIVFIPKLSDRFTAKNSTASSNTSTSAGGPSGTGAAASGAGGTGASGSGTDGGDSGGADGTGGAGGENGSGDTGVPGAGGGGASRLAGTVTGPVATGVIVKVESTSLADAAASGAAPADSGTGGQGLRDALGAVGKVPASAVEVTADDDCPSQQRTRTGPDGSFAFGCLTSRGFYLVTFAHQGFGEQKYIVDASTLADAEPMQVALAPDNGKLSGTVTGPDGPVGAATVAITDGTLSLSTSTVSPGTRGKPGTWSMSGLSTPGTYLITISSPGLGTVSMLKTLKAGGSGAADATMKAGVATVLGTVSGTDEFGNTGNLGGVTVSVTDGTITRTATTVTTGAVGSYALPDLPSPGSYTLTVTGTGFQVATRQIDIPAGVGSVQADISLTRTNGTVAGAVRAAGGGGLAGVGLTLTGEDATYKTISQTTPAGSYSFTGVAPGDYVLTGVLFGRIPSSVNVTVAAAGTTTVNLSLASDNLADVVRTSGISVRVVDDRSGAAIRCDRQPIGADEPCDVTIVGMVPSNPGTNRPDPKPVPVTAPGTKVQYAWPTTNDLPAGLYQLTVTAPGFEPSQVSVQVQQGVTATAPEVRLQPLGLVSGTVTSRVGTPTGRSCAVAYQLITQSAVPPSRCTVSESEKTCTAAASAGSVVSACAVVNPTKGTYSIPGLTHGGYQVRIIPTDPEYLATDPVSVLLGFGDDATVNAVLDRLGRLTVTTLAPDLATAALVPAAGSSVEFVPQEGAEPGLRVSGTTAENGTFTATGLRGEYRLTASGSAGTATVITPVVGLNQTLTASLVLTRPIGPVVGRVTTTFDGDTVPVNNTTVTITGITGFTGSTPVSGTATMITGGNGCFAVVPEGWTGSPKLKSTDCPTVDASAVAVAQTNKKDSSLVALPVTVSVAEADSRTESYQASGVLISDPPVDKVRSLATILVSAQPSKFGAHKMVASPSDAVIDVTTLVFEVTRQPAGAGAVTMSLASGGQLVFRDSSQPDSGLAVPGHYTMVAHNRGFADASFAVDCGLGEQCTLTQAGPGAVPDQLTLWQLPKISGELSLSALPPGLSDAEAAAVIEGATVTPLTVPPGTGTVTVTVSDSACSGGVSENLCRVLVFRDTSQLSSGLAEPGTYVFSYQLKGFGAQQLTVTCGADYRIGCDSMSLVLDRNPVFGGSVTLTPSSFPNGAVPTLSTVRVDVLSQPNPGASLSVTVDDAGVMHWNDGTMPLGLVVPGSYTLQFSRQGFETKSVTFDCPATAEQCTTTGPIAESATPAPTVLRMLPTGAGRVDVDLAPPAGGVPYAQATVIVNGPGGTGALKVTLDDTGNLIWNDPNIGIDGLTQPGPYTISVSIPGYTTVNSTVTCQYGLTCVPAFPRAARAPSFTGQAQVAPAAVVALSQAQFTVTSSTGSAQLTATDAGTLTWQEAGWPTNLVRTGTYQITAKLAGYDTDPVTFVCNPPGGGTTCPALSITFYLAGQFRIILADPDGNPVNGGRVTLSGSRIADTPATLSGNQVTFGTMPTVPSATYQISVSAPGFQTKTYNSGSAEVTCQHPADTGTVSTGLALQPGDITACTIKLTRLGTILGMAWSAISTTDTTTDTALSGAAVSACALANPATSVTACTAAAPFTTISTTNGTFALTGTATQQGLLPGTWLVTVSVSGAASVTGTVTIDDAFQMVTSGLSNALLISAPGPDGPARVQARLLATRISLTVTPKTTFGAPVLPAGTYALAGANGNSTCVVPAPAGQDSICTVNAQTNSIVFSQVNPGTYTLSANPPNPARPSFLPASVPVEVQRAASAALQNQQVPITLTMRTSTLSITVSRATADTGTGSWTAGASVTVLDANTGLIATDNNGVELRTGINGAELTPVGTNRLQAAVSFGDVLDGLYKVQIVVPGYAPITSGNIQLWAQSSPTPPNVPFTLVRATRSVSVALSSTAAGAGPAALNGAAAVLHQVSIPAGSHVPADPDITGLTVSGGVVSYSQLPSGTWQVRITGGPAPAGAPPATSGDISIPDPTATDAGQLTPSAIVGQGAVNFTVTWPKNDCTDAAGPGTNVTVRVTATTPNPDVSFNVTLPISVQGTDYQATGTALLPPGAYTWTTTGLPTGWGDATGSFTITVPNDAAAGSVAAVASGGPALPATVPTTVSLTVDGAGWPSATATATRGTTTVNEPINNGTADLCLAPVGGWTISVGDDAILLPDKTNQTVTRAGPNTFAFTGSSFTPSALLAAVAGRTAQNVPNVAVTLKQGATTFWSDSVTVPGSSTWTGPTLVLPTATYDFAAAPPASAAFGSATRSVNVSTTHTAPLTLPYVRAMFTVAVTTSTGAVAAGASVSLDGGAARTANPSGEVLYTDLAPGTHSITATLGTTRTVSHDVPVGVSTFGVQLPAAAGGNGAGRNAPQPPTDDQTTSAPAPSTTTQSTSPSTSASTSKAVETTPTTSASAAAQHSGADDHCYDADHRSCADDPGGCRTGGVDHPSRRLGSVTPNDGNDDQHEADPDDDEPEPGGLLRHRRRRGRRRFVDHHGRGRWWDDRMHVAAASDADQRGG